MLLSIIFLFQLDTYNSGYLEAVLSSVIYFYSNFFACDLSIICQSLCLFHFNVSIATYHHSKYVMTYTLYIYISSSCRPLFANGLLVIIQTLLEQTRAEEMRIIGCNTLVDFINCQVLGY